MTDLLTWEQVNKILHSKCSCPVRSIPIALSAYLFILETYSINKITLELDVEYGHMSK